MTPFDESWDPFCGMTIAEHLHDTNNRLMKLEHWMETGIYPLQGEHLQADPRKQTETCDRVEGPALTE